ncbi:hypothetical protein [Paenibacillus sp. DMB20]|uniref:hypothetical protein n=1 Tax=Paenibacillus sp. DMB20 TaxID=1642570 RepID=UPI001F197782|nr:hypothetical protein [Paenibacillus sp. DMB20]
MAESQRALAYLHPGNLPVRTATAWTLGYAHQLQGDRAEGTPIVRSASSFSSH